MNKVLKKLFPFLNKEVEEKEDIRISHRMAFGTKVMVNNSVYRYIYSQNDDDVLYNEINQCIFVINQKNVIFVNKPDEKEISQPKLNPREWLLYQISSAMNNNGSSSNYIQIAEYIEKYVQYQKDGKLI